MKTLNEQMAAERLAALGNRTRLRLFRLLVKAGCGGLNIGEIQEHMGAAPSTLAHHIAALVRAGLVDQERQGREIVSTANFAAMQQLGTYLLEDCCKGVSQKKGKSAA